MNTRNPSGQSQKQRELVERLEEIRQKRNTAEGRKTTQTQRRNEGQQTKRPARETRRKANQQKKSAPGRQVDTGQFNQPSYQQKQTIEERASMRSSTIGDISEVSDIKDMGQKTSSRRITSKSASNIINKLSNGNSLAESMVINEILSKPIALKKRYR